jgi:hypothetical protein
MDQRWIVLMFGILHESELQMISQVRNRLAGVISSEKVFSRTVLNFLLLINQAAV